MKIAVLGAGGTMGARAMRVGQNAGHDMVAIDPFHDDSPSRLSNAPKVDVCIDFSHPAHIDSLLEDAKKFGVPLVIATTGYNEEQSDEIEDASFDLPIFKSANMAYSVHVFKQILADYAKALEDYDIEITEHHHRYKLDAPSGTALMLGETINDALGGNHKLNSGSRSGKRNDDEIGMSVVRGGNIVGKHDVMFASAGDVFTLSHEALSKDLFAEGAIKAALYIINKKPGLYDMNDLIKESRHK